ncbi:epoxyqueuosine reductase [Maritalea myrionectae]|uniref:Epoxyqueuosine reductase n=1 Tax=Maritalea myrionectae TaxID=454601 RepID=A0A2R4MIK7_9HYPH|nr:tRNA epoxyqueuosine(34) reductase QueG [Maritalea myrionectae]AVX05858.1 epoxyqueuosine reductase [Maritalea myrionectae]
MTQSAEKLRQTIEARARDLGFVSFGVAQANGHPEAPERLNEALARDFHGDMHWLKDTLDRRTSPQHMWPEAKSALVLGYNYGPDQNPLDQLDDTENGLISVYARHRDYHDIIKGKLKEIAGLLARQGNCEVKVFVDTAPLMEKPLGEQAGIGWQGKHTVLVSRDHGCWLFLGTILTDMEFAPDAAGTDRCGNCRRCLDVCPTNAFPAPYQLDARRCIAYLTNEYKGIIPVEFRKPIGNRIYGCDDCLAVCPWNKFASVARDEKLRSREDLRAPSLVELAKFDDADFRAFFKGSPIKRLGRDAFIRNVLIALGNAPRKDDIVAAIKPHLSDESALVRAAAVWAIDQHYDSEAFDQLRQAHYPSENDHDVCAEWDRTAP